MTKNITKNHKDNNNAEKAQASAMQIEIAGVKINDNKPIFSELLKVHGVGNSTAEAIIMALGLAKHSRLSNCARIVKETLLKIVQELLDAGFLFGNDLRMQKRQNIKRKISSGSYQGRRHARGQPVRYANTRSNGKTAKRLGKVYKTMGGQ